MTEVLSKRQEIDKQVKNKELKLTDGSLEENGDFNKFPISEKTAKHLQTIGIMKLFPIQFKTFNNNYDGCELISKDRKGRGKTLAFSLPILERLRRKNKYFLQKERQYPLVLCIVPTRELAIQVTNEFERFKNEPNEYRVVTVYGGSDVYLQKNKLRAGTEIVIATPGRLIDLIQRKDLILKKLKCLILDETDQMLNFGFQEEIEKVLKAIKSEFEESERSIDELQILLFSATIPSWVQKISSKFMKSDAKLIDMVQGQDNRTSKTVEHLAIYIPSKELKIPTIGDIVQVYGGCHSRTIIFTDRKDEANEVMLHGNLKVECQVLHGDIPQKQREVTFASFRNGKLKCLVATNVAARGLDIPEVDLIIQLSPPEEIEAYIHRSGRTGRAGKSGTCVTFYTRRQQDTMRKIEDLAKMTFKKVGAPQPADIVKATARDIEVSLDSVAKEVLPLFSENTKEILSRYSAEEAISRAIAIISGCTKQVKQRSLLCSMEGYLTYLIETEVEANGPGYFWNLFRNNYSNDLVESIKGMKLLSNRRGAVFDLKDDFQNVFEESIESMKKRGFKISLATKLPETDDYENSRSSGYGSRGNNRDNERFSNRRGNDRGDRNSSRGGNSNRDDNKLFITNIGDSTELELKDFVYDNHFKVNDVFIIKGPDGVSKGFGYLRFDDRETAEKALRELNGKRINNRSVRMEFAQRKN